MSKLKWTDPVQLRDHQNIRLISGPSDALACLSERWPARRGPRYVSARSICRAAIDGRKSAEDARAVFFSAAEEANLHPR